MSGDLHVSRLDLVEPQAILALLGKLLSETASATVLFYCPGRCVLAHMTRAKGFESAEEGVVEPSAAYEIVVFCPDWEFRWLRDGPSGIAWLLADTALALGDGQPQMVKYVEQNYVDYLVWGRNTDDGNAAPGWVILTDPQIGTITLPADDTDADEYLLRTIEYFVEDNVHGNVTVGLQRLAAITPRRTPEQRTRTEP